jgi:hypothetical protein
MRFNTGSDRVISAIVLIVCGLLQMSGQFGFPLWLVVVCLGLMVMTNTR